jgi:limonene-1,2-epoxide hydrolase
MIPTALMTQALNPRETVRLFLLAMETLNFREAVKYIADDCDYSNPNTQAGSAHAQPSLDASDVQRFRASASPSIVLVERTDRHLRADQWVELAVTGVFEVRDGQIVFWRDYVDGVTTLAH